MRITCKLKQLPWPCCLINVFILVTAFIVYFAVTIQGNPRFNITYDLIGIGIIGGFFASIILAYQLLVYFLLRNKLANRTIFAVILLTPGVLLSSYVIRSSLPTVRANSILSRAGLAPLPKTANSIKVYTWSSPFSGEEYLMFRASPEVLEDYITKSSSVLTADSCRKYTEKNMRLYYPYHSDDSAETIVKRHEEMRKSANEYIQCPYAKPVWFNSEIKNGRRYEFNVEGYQLPCELIINTDENTIYVRLVFS